MKLHLLLLALVPVACALNIVISTTDSWVSKNARYLFKVLQEHGHNVVLIGNLYEYQDKCEEPKYTNEQNGYSKMTVEPIKNGGAFGHLLPVHQTYFKSINHIVREHKKRCHQRGAKNVIFFNSEQKALVDQEHEKHQAHRGKHHKKPILFNAYGQDPLERDAWYVNHLGPHSLIFGLDVILPQFYPNMTPDLIILGPTDAPTTDESVIDALQLIKQREEKGFSSPTILAVSTNDDNGIYYQDETYFNVQTETYETSIKSNVVAKNLHFINKKILELVYFEELGDRSPLITMKFPLLNKETISCNTEEDDISFKKLYTSVKTKEVINNKNSNEIKTPIFKYNGPNDIRINLTAWKSLLGSREIWGQVTSSKQDHENSHLDSCKISVNYMNFE